MESLLGCYRLLDLTDEKGFMCGQIFADLGADVIKVERPEGDQARNYAPFVSNDPGINKNLYWAAFNTGKRGITLNFEHPKGQEIFKRLIKSADFVVESFKPGFIDKIGLGYSDIKKVNPQIILTSISPFGQKGPYRDYKGTDLIIMAMSGIMSLTGAEDRAPLRLCLDQTYCTAGNYAVFASLLANHWRILAGEGQHIDVSMLDAAARMFLNEPANWQFEKKVRKRSSKPQGMGREPIMRLLWSCADGIVFWYGLGSRSGVETDLAMNQWLAEQSESEILKTIDWGKLMKREISIDKTKQVEAAIAEIFLKYTKKELEGIGKKTRSFLVPMRNIEDVVKSKHLADRDYWSDLESPDLGRTIGYPGHFFISSVSDTKSRFRAPLLGEHNREIYGKELGFSLEEIKDLERNGVI